MFLVADRKRDHQPKTSKRHLPTINIGNFSGDGVREQQEQQLIGESPAFLEVLEHASRVAPLNRPVLVIGERGTGKELIAARIHYLSSRWDGPLVKLNCAALAESLLETELFGHEAGAFTGASRRRLGRFELANQGSLFLDELANTSSRVQEKILRVIEYGELERVGGNDTIRTDVRIIGATHEDLPSLAAEGRFRADLLYRLNVVTLDMPVLDARREDIPVVFLALLRDAANRYEREIPHVDGAVLSQLAMRNWPGNVRELRNAAERFVLGLSAQTDFDTSAPTSLADRMAAHEKALIAAAIAANGGRLKETYESLGLSRKALYDKMQRYGLARADFADDG